MIFAGQALQQMSPGGTINHGQCSFPVNTASIIHQYKEGLCSQDQASPGNTISGAFTFTPRLMFCDKSYSMHVVLPAVTLADTATSVWTLQHTVAPQVCMPAMSEDKRNITLAGTTSKQLGITQIHRAATSLRVKISHKTGKHRLAQYCNGGNHKDG